MNTSPIAEIARNETTADQIARIERLILADRTERKEAIANGDERTAEVLANSILNRMEKIEKLEGKTADEAITPKPAPMAEIPTRSFNI